MMKRFFIFLSILIALPFSAFSQEVYSTKLSRDTILIGDQIEWVTKMSIPSDLTMEMDSISNPVVEGVELIGALRIDTLKLKKDFMDIEARAIITSFDSGSYVVPAKVIYLYRGGTVIDSLILDSLKLEVTTIPIDTTTYQMFDIKEQFNYPVTIDEVLPWIGLALLILAIAYLVYRLIKNRRENKTIFGKPIIVDPPHITALRCLEQIRNDQLWQNDKQKQYYTLITDAIRVYIEGRFKVQAMEQTSKEILDMLAKQKIEPREFEGLADLFEVADLVKFAKHKASTDENENAIPSAVRFVNATFLQEIEEGHKNG